MEYFTISVAALAAATYLIYIIANKIFKINLRIKPLVLCACCSLFISTILPRFVVGIAGIAGTIFTLIVCAVLFSYFIAYHSDTEEIAEAEIKVTTFTSKAENDVNINHPNRYIPIPIIEEPNLIKAPLDPPKTLLFDNKVELDEDVPTMQDEDEILASHDEEDIPAVQDEDEILASQDEDVPAVQDEDEILASQDEDVPAVQDEDELLASHDEDAPAVQDEDELLASQDEDAPAVQDEDELLASQDEDVPAVQDEDEILASHDEDVPAMQDEDELLASQDEDVPAVQDEDELLASQDEDVPAMQDEDKRLASHDEEDIPAVQDEDKRLASHDENEPTVQDEDKLLAPHDDEDIPAVQDEDELLASHNEDEPTVQDEDEHLASQDEDVPAAHDEENVITKPDEVPLESELMLNDIHLLESLDDFDDVLDYAFNQKDASNSLAALKAFQKSLSLCNNDEVAPLIVIEIGNIFKTRGQYDDAIQILSEGRTLPSLINNGALNQQFIEMIAFLRIIKNNLLENRIGFVPYDKIPSDLIHKINEEFRDWLTLSCTKPQLGRIIEQ